MKVMLDNGGNEFEYSAIVKVKRVDDKAKIPTRGSAFAAGYDMYANLDVDELAIAPHTTVKIGTGVAMEIPVGYFGAIYARSGLATKKGLRPANAVGIVDAG